MAASEQKDYLVFHLYGPMASFGDVAVGEYRPTHAHPTKSAIVGLIAGALGILRNEDEKHLALDAGLGFAVLVLSSGQLLRDYHTSQVPPSGKKAFATRKDELSVPKSDLGTILSTRDYRTDALYKIAIWKKMNGENQPGFNLQEICKALNEPFFAPYIGRKSCPLALPLDAKIVKAKLASDALINQKLPIGTKYLEAISMIKFSGKENITMYTDDSSETARATRVMQVTKKDRLISRKRWQFGDRIEYQIAVDTNGGNDVL